MDTKFDEVGTFDEETKLLSKKEMAAELGVSYRTIERWFNSGYLKRIRIGGRIFFTYSEVYRLRDQFVEEAPRANYLEPSVLTIHDLRREQEQRNMFRQ